MFMFENRIVSLLLLTLFSYGSCQQAPTTNQFLSALFNAPENNIMAVANNFTFITGISSDINFLLYQSNGGIVWINSQNATNAINASNPTKIIIHGWTDSGISPWIQNMASLYHQKGGYNVISVDWSLYADEAYPVSAAAVQFVGYVIGAFLLDIAQQISNFLATVHLIGHSLGAHVAGFAGKYTQANQGNISRITGLDAAGPLFEIPVPRPAAERLAETDAPMVDLIHTDCGIYGVTLPYGLADFYFNNGGPFQPNCPIDPLNVDNLILCSHNDSYVYYSQTILNPTKYEGVACKDAASNELGLCTNNQKAIAGDQASPTASGTFYVDTQ